MGDNKKTAPQSLASVLAVAIRRQGEYLNDGLRNDDDAPQADTEEVAEDTNTSDLS